MNIIDARKMNAEEIAALLKKKAFDETELSPGVQAACDQMWGEHLTAAQIVDRIVDYVRRVGDEALLYFTNTIHQHHRSCGPDCRNAACNGEGI